MASPMPRLAPVMTAVLPSSAGTGSIPPSFPRWRLPGRTPRGPVASRPVNHLADETSPYLRQHADNPVEWFPWGEEALEKAAAEDKPIFLSIGYASCHWCHVMAHESFEDQATADDLARWFVSVKVDREERPDLDSLYMAATQSLTGSGGWPMSVFCTPDGRPFYAGTYFPPEDRHGMPSFRRVVEALGTAWEKERETVLAQADALVDAVRREVRLAEIDDRVRVRVRVRAAVRPVRSPRPRPRRRRAHRSARHRAGAGFRPAVGRIRPAPKFPRPSLVELCLRHYRRTGSERSRQMALTTLDAMAAGGMYDHLVGGFCRYSTDNRWLVPHFEKMLTDQALLARAYLHAWQETGRDNYLAVVTETLDFVLDDLSTPEGALYSSFDADAGGVEGSHATFTLAELERGAPRRTWSNRRPSGTGSRPRATGRAAPSPSDPSAPRSSARPRSRRPALLLAAVRAARVQPARDEKVLTEWNAMAAATLAEVAAVTGSDRYARRAEEIGEFLMSAMYDGRRLMRSWQGGRARHLAVAADHAWLIEACVRLSELTGKSCGVPGPTGSAGSCWTLFWDDGAGGFFTTGDDAESAHRAAQGVSRRGAARHQLHRRPRPPPGQRARRRRGAAPRHRPHRGRSPGPASPAIPGALADLVAALPMLAGRQEIVVTGDRPDLLAEVRRRWLPDAVVAWGEPDGSPLFADRPDGSAFVCRGFACAAPAGDVADAGRRSSRPCAR